MTTLVFPSSTPAGRAYLVAAAARGEAVVGASSLTQDAAATLAPWERLPSIHDDDFDAALGKLVERHGVTGVYPTVVTVQIKLEQWIDAYKADLRLVDQAPVFHAFEASRRDRDEGRALHAFAASLCPGSDIGDETSFAGALRAVMRLFGESYGSKLAALLAVCADAPAGDVVEIGSLFGRVALTMELGLKRMGRENAVLAVDPWNNQTAIQHSLPDYIRERFKGFDAGLVLDAFDMDLSVLARPGRFNRIQADSLGIAPKFGPDFEAVSTPFGTTRYEGRIALLHIDGNHDLAAVKADYEGWAPHMAPGGWIVFDDYSWMHADGPRVVADAACDGLVTGKGGFERGFACGGALFLKLKGGA